MKLRHDFVSNSSSTSFIVRIENKKDILKYANLITPKLSKKLKFDYVIISLSDCKKRKIIRKVKSLISIEDSYIIENLKNSFGLDIDNERYAIIQFEKFLSLWKKKFLQFWKKPDLEFRNKLIRSIKYFITETCWSDADALFNENIEDYKIDLRKFLDDNKILHKTEDAFI